MWSVASDFAQELANYLVGEWLMTWLTVFVGPIGLENVGANFWGWVLSGNIVAIIFVSVPPPLSRAATDALCQILPVS